MVEHVMSDDSTSLGGQLLVAMPNMPDPRFSRSVIYLCAHTDDGAMGLVINKPIDSLTFPDLLKQLEIETGDAEQQIRVHFGGPVESARGFVLHSADYEHESTLVVNEQFSLTATIDVLKALADGSGPGRSILALGYAGWAPGQLDDEIRNNGWLTAPASEQLVFEIDNEQKWEASAQQIGIDLGKLSSDAGHA